MSQETPQITGPTPLDEHEVKHNPVAQTGDPNVDMQLDAQQMNLPAEQPVAANTAAIYFCFIDDKFDKSDFPNKLILARAVPTVADLCSTLKVLFFPSQDLTLTAAFLQGLSGAITNEYPETSPAAVPVNDRSNVVVLKARYPETPPKLMNPHTIQMTHWLQGHSLDTPEILNVFQQNRITVENMKFLKDQDLITMGIRDWGTRVNIMEAINKYFSMFPPLGALVDTSTLRQHMFDLEMAAGHTPMHESHKRKFEGKDFTPNKKPKTPLASKKRIRFKDLDVLVNDPLLPVDIGSTVTCEGSTVRGTVVLNKQKKPVIEFLVKGKKRPATIAQFYKAVTGEPLQAKGDSWSKIFFSDLQTNQLHSLEELKYIIKGPRKAVSAFLYFSKEIRETLPKGADFAKKSGDMWKNLSEEQKLPYKQKEAEDKIRFRREKEHWLQLTSQLQQQRGVESIDLPWKYEGEDSQTGDEH